MSKITEIAVKSYKPEILNCPICNTKMKYCYTVSNKVVQFTSGKYFRIKNLGYKCPKCDGDVFFSQTANKLAFKGYTYSAKIICMIEYYKSRHYGREKVCDILAAKGIEVSDRNVDLLYNKFKESFNMDIDSNVNNAYAKMIEKYNEIRISIDHITVNENNYIILYDYFTSDMLGLWKFNGIDDPDVISMLRKYIDPRTTVIASVRNIGKFLPKIKEVCIEKEMCPRFIAYQKF